MVKDKKTKKVIEISGILFMCLFSFIMVTPMLWLISASFQNQGEIFKVPFKWIPSQFTFDNYIAAWNYGMKDAAMSSIKVMLLYVPFHLFFCTGAGYVLAKYKFKFSKTITMLIMMTMMIPQEVTYFQVYGLVRDLNLLDTPFGVALPFVYSGFGIIFMLQSAKYIPNELTEAAKIDGCNDFQTYFTIVLPLMKSSVSALGILAFSFIWDEYAWSRLAIASEEGRTLPILLAQLAKSSDNSTQFPILIGGSVLVMLPVLIFFMIFQKNFIESVAGSGIKG